MIVFVVVLAIGLCMIAYEYTRPGRNWPKVRTWWLRAIMWDMLFGTFRNPTKWDARCGFGQVAELRVGEMLRGVDVNRNAPANPQ